MMNEPRKDRATQLPSQLEIFTVESATDSATNDVGNSTKIILFQVLLSKYDIGVADKECMVSSVFQDTPRAQRLLIGQREEACGM